MIGCTHSVDAVESGFGLYILGYQGPKAGILPPEGVYVRDDLYHYHGHIKESVMGGVAQAKAKMSMSLNLLNLTYVTPLKIFGGDLACCVIVPVGRVGVHASASASLGFAKDKFGLPEPLHVPSVITKNKHQVAHGLGDTFVLPCIIGWHFDTFHALVALGGFIPTGKFRKGHIANMGQHHYALESDIGFTWLDPKIGTEVSIYTGLTKNFTNHKIHYRSGTEWHTEFYLGQYLTKDFEIGLCGYWYKQISGDRGKGAVLGGFMGRDFAIGPSLSYLFTVGKTPIQTNARYYKETSAKHHFKGHSFFFNVSFPIL